MSILAIFFPFLLGALHALEPGHGKAAIVAYTVGNRTSLRHVLVLGLTTALAHTAIIILLAAIFGAAVNSVSGAETHHFLEIGSAVLLVVIGAVLLVNARRTKHKEIHQTGCKCGGQHNHQQPENEIGERRLSFGVVGLLGASSGLIPCPSALAALVAAVAAGQVFYGVGTVLLFSAGLAATLSAVGLAAYFAAKSPTRKMFPAVFNAKWAGQIPVLSALLITLCGAFSLCRAVLFS